MTDQAEQALMAKHGITSESKLTFHYKGFKYQTLKDAVSYARSVDLAGPEAVNPADSKD